MKDEATPTTSARRGHIYSFEQRTQMPASARALFAYHAAPLAFQRLTPPWDDIVMEQPLRHLEDGAVAAFSLPVGPLAVRWVATHHNVRDGRDGNDAGFIDEMQQGPFSRWRHRHTFEAQSDSRSTLIDSIEYALPRLPGASFAAPTIERRLQSMFRFRHATTALDLDWLPTLASAERRPVVVGITGASGLIGQEISSLLSVLGIGTRRFVRVQAPATTVREDELAWVPESGFVDPRASGLSAVIHLAGESIGAGRLSVAKQERVREQRVRQTRLFLDSLARLPLPPGVVVSASAVGFYGDRGEDELDEQSVAGLGLLPTLCTDWEEASLAPRPFRAVAARFGVVLSPRGGALKKMLPLFLAGAGGPLGDGGAFMPLITIDDAAGVLLRALLDARLIGPVNGVAWSVRNAEFTATLAHVLRRPAVLRAPRLALRAAFGALADEALLASARVAPKALVSVGHRFRHANVEAGLRHVLGR